MMSFDFKTIDYPGINFESLKNEFINFNKDNEFVEAPTLDVILSNEFNDWGKVKTCFNKDFRFFDELLLQLKYKRKACLTRREKNNALKFLIIGYLLSNDVRYFNEFLWFSADNESFKPLSILMLRHFNENLDNKNCHTFPLAKRENILEFIDAYNKSNKIPNPQSPSYLKRIGLIGVPFFFKNIYGRLNNDGYQVESFYLTHHSEKIKKMFLKSGLIFWLFTKIKRLPFKPERIDYDHRNPKISRILSSRKLEIGFHKLGFIIKKNIIDAFSIGLLNDHWGVLPFIRGRSSIEFSILFGFPLGVTVHFIDEGIDTGELVKFYSYEKLIGPVTTIKSVKKEIGKRLDDRVVDSIKQLYFTGFKKHDNDVSKGLTYYSMHPDLLKFIERETLKLNKNLFG